MCLIRVCVAVFAMNQIRFEFNVLLWEYIGRDVTAVRTHLKLFEMWEQTCQSLFFNVVVETTMKTVMDGMNIMLLYSYIFFTVSKKYESSKFHSWHSHIRLLVKCIYSFKSVIPTWFYVAKPPMAFEKSYKFSLVIFTDF